MGGRVRKRGLTNQERFFAENVKKMLRRDGPLRFGALADGTGLKPTALRRILRVLEEDDGVIEAAGAMSVAQDDGTWATEPSYALVEKPRTKLSPEREGARAAMRDALLRALEEIPGSTLEELAAHLGVRDEPLLAVLSELADDEKVLVDTVMGVPSYHLNPIHARPPATKPTEQVRRQHRIAKICQELLELGVASVVRKGTVKYEVRYVTTEVFSGKDGAIQ